MSDARRTVMVASGTAATLVALQVASKAVRDALFLTEFGASQLPKAVMAAAVLSLVSVAIVTSIVARFGPRKTTAVLLGVSAVTLVGEYSLFENFPAFAAGLFYLHTAALGALVISGIWSAISECFDPNTARKNISTIAAWATAGGLAGGLLAERLSAWFSPQMSLLFIAGGHALSAILVMQLNPVVQQKVTEVVSNISVGSVLKNPYVRNMIMVVVFATAAGNVMDYILKFTADELLPDDELVGFFGVYYTAIGVATFAIQVAFTKKILARAGVARTTMVLPAVAAAGSILVVIFPSLVMAAVVRGAEAVTRNSLFRSSYELLFAPLSPPVRRRIKTWIDVGADRLGDLVGGALVAGVLFLVAKPTLFLFGVLALSLSVGMLSVVSQLRERYQNALANALEEGDSDTILAQTFAGFGGSEISMFTQTMFNADKPFEFSFDLGDEPTESSDDGLQGLVEELKKDRVSPVVLEEVRNLVQTDATFFCAVLNDHDTEFIVRRRLPKLLINGDERVVAGALLEALDDKRFEVRFQAARALYLLKNRDAEFDTDIDVNELIRKEVRIHRNVWNSRVALEKEADAGELNELKNNRSLEHIFYLLCLKHDPTQIQRSFRGLTGDDVMQRGTAIEFVDSLLPTDVSKKLWALLDF